MEEQAPVPGSKTLSYESAAEYLGVTVGTLRRAKVAGELNYYQLGRNVRFSHTQLDAWLQTQERQHS